jgi:hypothetical protein
MWNPDYAELWSSYSNDRDTDTFLLYLHWKNVAFHNPISWSTTTFYMTGDMSRIFFNMTHYREAYSADTDKQINKTTLSI